MGHKNIDGIKVSRRILKEVRGEALILKESGWQPRLVSVTVGDVKAVQLYVRNQRRMADQASVIFEERCFPSSITQVELLAAIHAMNVDPQINGIILQRPISEHLSIKALQESVHPFKDVEGMHPASIGKIVYNESELGPCTAIAAVELLKSTGVNIPGIEATIIGHSEIVGKPIAFLLMAEGSTVTVCHHMTRNIMTHTRKADVVFVAVGKPGLLTGEMLKPGAVVIDIGINQIEDKNGTKKVVGDADYVSCAETAGWITPVPGGVGPVTVSILMRNAVRATRRQQNYYENLFTQSVTSVKVKQPID